MSGGGIEKIVDEFFEYIFPSFCVSCKKEGDFMCCDCQKTLDVSGVFCCPVCHTPREGGVCCDLCALSSPLYAHIAIILFTETSLIHTLMHLYKYQYVEKIEKTFRLFIKNFLDVHQLPSVDYLVPVPLHRKRYVERGFNQSERIASILSLLTGVPVLKSIRRVKNTIKQATLDRTSRETNVQDAFEIIDTDRILLSGKNVLLVDDVYTTGSTLRECSATLREGGVERVYGFSLARG